MLADYLANSIEHTESHECAVQELVEIIPALSADRAARIVAAWWNLPAHNRFEMAMSPPAVIESWAETL